MTDNPLMNITLLLTCIFIFGLIVVFIADRLNAPPQEYVLKTPTHADTWTSSRGCDCDCNTDATEDVALMHAFNDIASTGQTSDVRNAANAALMELLQAYGPDDEDEDNTEEGEKQ
jgi:hypothetical protein